MLYICIKFLWENTVEALTCSNECTKLHNPAWELAEVFSSTKVNFVLGFPLSLYFNKETVEHDLLKIMPFFI